MKQRASVCRRWWWVGLVLVAPLLCSAAVRAGDSFAIQVVDDATGRGVPLVRLETTSRVRYYTDSNGYIAFDEPGLMDEQVWFSVFSHGYSFPKDGMGQRGVALKTAPGGSARIRIHRNNIAERLYRVTGQGIYRDTVLLGMKAPIEHPLLNARVTGQDSAQTALYRGKLYWFWGDTNRLAHPLGNFFTTGAVSDLPASGGLAPGVGVNLRYFTDPRSGFARAMAPLNRDESLPVWIDGLMVVPDEAGHERLLARYVRPRNLKPVEQGLLQYDDAKEQFEDLKNLPLDATLLPAGHPFRAAAEGKDYLYFPNPYPNVRVRREFASASDPAAYEGYTCVKPRGEDGGRASSTERDADGKPLWRWRRGAAPMDSKTVDALVASGDLTRAENPYRLEDAKSGKPIALHTSTIYWNEFRRAWVMIGVQQGGDSYLGEVWYAEADRPEGPWIKAVKVATHAAKDDNQDFYNPIQHPCFAEEGGRFIYFEGTYVNTFSGNPHPTPFYDYNQLMYRLDLSDPRLRPAMRQGGGE